MQIQMLQPWTLIYLGDDSAWTRTKYDENARKMKKYNAHIDTCGPSWFTDLDRHVISQTLRYKHKTLASLSFPTSCFPHSIHYVHWRRPLTRNYAYAPWWRSGVDTGERQQRGRAKLKASAAKEESSGGSGDHILQSPRFRILGFATLGRDPDTRRVIESGGYGQGTIPIALLPPELIETNR
jgi:hypothetical protein